MLVTFRAGRAKRVLTLSLLALASMSASAAPQTFVGTVADSECGTSHDNMRMGPDDAGCTKACIDAHGASLILHDGTRVYALSDQRASQAFAGKRVKVIGTLDASGKSIQVDSITASTE
jgi:hypothetical protein